MRNLALSGRTAGAGRNVLPGSAGQSPAASFPEPGLIRFLTAAVRTAPAQYRRDGPENIRAFVCHVFDRLPADAIVKYEAYPFALKLLTFLFCPPMPERTSDLNAGRRDSRRDELLERYRDELIERTRRLLRDQGCDVASPAAAELFAAVSEAAAGAFAIVRKALAETECARTSTSALLARGRAETPARAPPEKTPADCEALKRDWRRHRREVEDPVTGAARPERAAEYLTRVYDPEVYGPLRLHVLKGINSPLHSSLAQQKKRHAVPYPACVSVQHGRVNEELRRFIPDLDRLSDEEFVELTCAMNRMACALRKRVEKKALLHP